MTGVLLIDKPSGPTSHDVVARIRRAIGERRVGHTGTLDPTATGLLPLVVGTATRLASLLTGRDKTYLAVVRLGLSTDTDDAEGEPIGPRADVLPDDDQIDAALAGFRGEHAQTPPRHSAKKIRGQKAYELARRDVAVELAPVIVTVRHLERTRRDGDRLHLEVTASAGFYVRALARDLGAALGCGAHLAELRRTRSGHFDVSQATPLEDAERMGRAVGDVLISPTDALPHLASVQLTEAGLKRAAHGNPVSLEHLTSHWIPAGSGDPVKVLAPDGRLLALAHARGGALHPAVVLG